MKSFLKFCLLMLCTGVAMPALAQEVEMADALRSDGKIYVLVIMILIVLAGLVTYLFLTDRKLSRLEKKLEELQQTKSGANPFS